MKYFYCDACFLITTYQEKYLGALSQYKSQFFISDIQIDEEIIYPEMMRNLVLSSVTIIQTRNEIDEFSINLKEKYRALSKYDCLSLAFALIDKYCLVTDDKALQKIATSLGALVKNTDEIINEFNLEKEDKEKGESQMNKNVKQIKPMSCPVCDGFYFSKLSDFDIKCGDTPNSVQCRHCGWYYDLEQTLDPNLKNQTNALSLNEYKAEYQKKISENPNYDYSEEHVPEAVPHKCPVCGEYTFNDDSSYDICPICGWEDDGWFEGGGANAMSLEEAIADFKKHREADPEYKWIKA